MIDSGTMRGPSEFGFGDLFDLVGEAVVVADSVSGRIVLWNEAATRMFGYSAPEAVGTSVSALVPEELRASHLAGIARFAAEGTIKLTPPGQTVEVPAIDRDGTRFWVELSLTALHGANHRMALALIRDVNDRHRAQDELKRANQALRDFVAVAAHDLRSPTAAIASGIEVLREMLEEANVSGDVLEMAQLVQQQAHGQLALIEDLLDTASLDGGMVRVNPGTVLLADEIATAAAGQSGFGMSVASDLSCVVDPRHIQRILTNLILNAYRHGAPPVNITAKAAGEMVEIVVRDAGDGVPPELRPRLFDPYVAGAESQGTGLGLSIARGLARANDGDLNYETTEPDGWAFVLRLPSGSAA
ncbi:MAG: PAS domain-containing sensor histidine kinase [Acidimicrobiales bacterium]|nr:PAS domain-containing sensor histidine kinase [Acidimicrobiales bacterium]